MSREDFRREQRKLDQGNNPSWDGGDQNRPRSLVDDDEVRVLRPKAAGDGMEWVTIRREELFGRTSRWLNRGVACTAIGLAVAASIGFAALFAKASWSALGSNPSTDDALAATERVAPAPLLTEQDLDTAEAAVRGFCDAPDLETRLRWVRNPERASRLSAGVPFEAIRLGERLREKLVEGDGRVFVVLAFRADESPKGYRFFAVERRPDGKYRVDWEFATAHQIMPLGEFRLKRPQTAVGFRVKAVRARGGHSSQFPPEDYACYELSYPGHEFSLRGFIRHDHPHAMVLDAECMGGGASVVLGLRYPEGGGDSADEVAIDSLQRTSWFY